MRFKATTTPAPSGFYGSCTTFAPSGAWTATLTPIDTTMANYVFNQPQITGLTGSTNSVTAAVAI